MAGGGFQGSDDGITKEKVIDLIKNIDVLENRKKNIEKELESFYNDARNKVEKERQGMLNKLNERSIEFDKQDEQLRVDKKEFEEYKKLENSRLGALKSEIDKQNEGLSEAQQAFLRKHTEFEKETALKTKFFADKEKFYQEKLKEIEEKEKMLKARDDSSLTLMEELQNKGIEIKKKEEDLKIKEDTLDVKLDKATILALGLEQEKSKYKDYETEIKNKLADADKILKDATNKIANADKLLSEQEAEKARLKAIEDDQVKEKEALSKWRDELNERNISLDERDKALVLREREIDKKIKIIQDLRRA